MKKLLSILFLFSYTIIVAQNFAEKDYYLIDSLDLNTLSTEDNKLLNTYLEQYHNAKDDTLKIKALTQICDNMVNESWKKYQLFHVAFLEKRINSGYDEKYRINYLKNYAGALNNLGIIYQESGELEQGLNTYEKCLKIHSELNNQGEIAICHTNMGVIYYRQGNIPKALQAYQKGLEIGDSLLRNDKNNQDFKAGIGSTLNNIGIIYHSQGDNKNALLYYKKSLKINRKVNDKAGVANALNNIGSIYVELMNFPLANKYYQEAIEVNKDIKDIKQLALNYQNIGNLFSHQGDYVLAQEYLQKSIDLCVQINDKYGLSGSTHNLGLAQKGIGNNIIAKQYIKRALEIAIEIKNPKLIMNTSKSLFEIFEEESNYNQALELYKLHIKMRDSLNSESTQKAAIQQQAKYEYEKQKAVDDAEHEKQIAIEQEAKEKQTILTYTTAGGLGLVAIFLLVVFNRLKVTRKQKNIIEEQKQEVENQKEVVELAHNELEEKNKEITDSIQYAKRIQNAILPPNKVVKEYLQESFIYYKPKDIVAGDFYWLESVAPTSNKKENILLFAAADCTGHGVPGAMVSVVCNNGLNRSVREYGLTDPGEILNKTREIVVQEFEKSEEEVKDGMDIALCSLEENKLQYAGAHNPLWIIRDGKLFETKANKQPIGQFDNPEPYTTHTLELQKGDSIYIFSDGYADQFGGDKGKKLKTANFKQLLLSIQKEPMEKQKQLIDEAFENWKGDLEQLDDVCVIGVRI
ncbi:MAG: tetratricopeptide repeat protein [Vicingaceae bacterium]|nr:tetratricopeptide repeat protein [Vicingaceae bacterium]